MFRCWIAFIFVLVSSCGGPEESTTTSPYLDKQVRNLEIRAARNDLAALRDLQLHYEFEQDDKRIRSIHQQRVKLRDPEALSDEIFKLIFASENTADCTNRKKLLSEAMSLASENARYFKVKDISTYDDVELVQREFDRLKC